MNLLEWVCPVPLKTLFVLLFSFIADSEREEQKELAAPDPLGHYGKYT